MEELRPSEPQTAGEKIHTPEEIAEMAGRITVKTLESLPSEVAAWRRLRSAMHPRRQGRSAAAAVGDD